MPYPAKKSDELIAQVLERIALGDTLRDCAIEYGFHPTAWNGWCRADKALGVAYQSAREIGFDSIADKTLEIADSTPARSEHIQLAKLRIDTRMKLLSKWSPHKYGDSSTLNLGNKDDETFKVTPTVDGVAITKTLGLAIRQGLLAAPADTTEGSDLL